MKTVIFFAVEPGLAHVTRSLIVAQELKKRGHKVIFAITKKKHDFIRAAGIPVMDLSVSMEEENGGFLHTRDRLTDKKFILSLAREEYAILKKLKPDCCVSDFRASAIASGISLNIPTILITNTNGLPCWFDLPNPGYHPLLYKAVTPIMNALIMKMKKPFYEAMHYASKELGFEGNLEDLIRKVTYIVPEPIGFVSTYKHEYSVHYVGPLIWNGFASFQPHWLRQIHPDGRTIYITFGGTGYDPKKLISLSVLLVDRGYRVIVSSSSIAGVDEFPKIKNLYVTKYISGEDAAKRSDLVICHGGFGTLTQALNAERPIIAIPYNPDQLFFSYKLVDHGVCDNLVRMKLRDILKLHWNTFQEAGERVSNDDILASVSSMLNKRKSLTHALHLLHMQFDTSRSAKRAADVVESVAR